MDLITKTVQMHRKLYIYLFTVLTFFISLPSISAKTEEKKFTIVIDAGHGGKDIGATENGVMEKNINLKVAKQLEAIIKKKMKGVKVVMTRDDDSYLTLQQRADKANKSQGDLFISIHTNSVDKKNKNRKNLEGSSVYTLGLHRDENNLEVARRENSVIELEQDYAQKYSGFDPQRDESYIIFEMAQKKNLSQSIKFAEDVENQLVASGRKNRGVHQAGFWVLWATSMPSVLIELDFICNPTSAKYLSSDKGSKELAEAIFQSVKKYESGWNKNNNVTKLQADEPVSEKENVTIEPTFTLVPTKSTGKVKTASSGTRRIATGSDKRKRRSQQAKVLAMNISYEKSDMVIPSGKNYSSVSYMPEVELQIKATGEPDKNKSKDKKGNKKKDKKETKREKNRRNDAHSAKLNKLVTVYKIQILSSPELLSQGCDEFCGLTPVSTFKENNQYKYYYGESTDKKELETLLTDVRKKIPDAFIVSSQKSVQKNK